MAIQIEFQGLGQDLVEGIRAALEATKQFRSEVEATNDVTAKGAQQSVAAQERYTTAVDASIAATAELGKQGTNGAKLAGDIDKAAKSAQVLDGALSEVERTNLGFLVNQAKEVAKAQGLVVKELDASRRAQLANLAAAGAVTQEEAELLGEVISVTEALQDQAQASKLPAEGVKSLKAQFLEAKNEATLMIQKFGEFSPEAIEATQRAAELKDQIGDFNDRLNALNPDAKFAAFGQVATSIAGGFTAAQGALALFGAESESVQKGLLKVQGALAITQGLQSFFSGFSDGLKNIRALLGLTAAAQVASTTATEADTVAKAANVTVTNASTVATGTMTGAVRALTAAVAANPLLAAAALVLAIGAALIETAKSAALATVNFDDLIQRFDALSLARQKALADKGNLQSIQDEIDLIRAGGNAIQERAIIEAKTQRELAALAQRRIDLERELALVRLQLADITVALGKATIIGDNDEIARLTERLKATTDNAKAIQAEVEQIDQDTLSGKKQLELDLLKFDKEAKDQRVQNSRDAADEERQIREQLVNDLVAIEKTLNDRIKALEIEQADPAQKLALQRQAAQDEITLLEQNLLRKKALIELEKEIGVAAFKELTEAQKQARADALIGSGQVSLDTQQLEQLQALELATWDKYYNDIAALQDENNRVKLDLLTDGQARERAQLELDLKAKADQLRAAGATEVEIEAFTQQQKAALAVKQEAASVDLEERIAIAKAKAIEDGGVLTQTQERAQQIALLNIQIEFAQKRLDLIAVDGTKESEARKAEAAATLADLRQQLAGVQANIPQVDLFDILGLELTGEDKARVKEGLSQVVGLIEQAFSAQQAEVDAAISATDAIIEDRERRTDSLREQLNQEIELAKLGQANNVDRVREEIAAEEAQAVKDKARKQQLLQEQKQLAQQQLAIDAVTQVSALITTGANVFKAESLKGIVGVVGAIGFIASVIASFAAFRARARALATQQQTFRKGGAVEGMMEGPTHEQGGLGIYDERTGERKGEMEGSEFIVNATTSKRHRRIVEAVNKNDISKVADLAIAELMASNNISLSSERVREVTETKNTLITSNTVVQQQENATLIKRVEAMTKEIKALRRDQQPGPKITPLDGGGYMVEEPGVTTIVRKKRNG